jgi:hypothetical protein
MQRTHSVLLRALATMLLMASAVGLFPPAAHADRDLVCKNAPPDVFADVPPKSTHAANIDCIAAYGITVGVGGGNYDPNGWVRRDQMASFLVNFVEVATGTPRVAPTGALPFDDIAGTTHATNIAIAADLGITIGRTPTSYAPGRYVTREQMATFVARTLEASGAELGGPHVDAFRDDDHSVHEANIDALAHLGVVRGKGANLYDPTGYVTRAQMASYLANAAGLLYDRGLWKAERLLSDGPEVFLVSRAGEALDTIEVRWDRSVDVTATGSDLFVTKLSDDDASTLTKELTHEDDVSLVVLEQPLVVDGTYWLHVADGVATDADGDVNASQRIAFTFAVDLGDGVDDGTGDGTGDETGDNGAGSPGAQPSILSVVTDPAGNRLVVTFDTPVTCPSTDGGRLAWYFANDSVVEGAAHAEGRPTTITQASASSTSCFLVYDVMENGDFGGLTYSQSGIEADRVGTSQGAWLPSSNNVRVTDGIAPTFDAVNAFTGSTVLSLVFSEPIACATVDKSQFVATIDGVSVEVVSSGCLDAATATPVITLGAAPVSGQTVSVTINSGTTLSDQSLDNKVIPGTRARTLPSS